MGRAPREKVWVVRPGDGATVAEIVTRMREDPARAVAEGRVFVGRRRVTTAGTTVKVGDEVKVGAPPETKSDARRVRFVDGGLVATVKEAGIPTVPDHAGAAHSHLSLVARELGRDAGALHVTSRLDREVSGVVLFAGDEATAARLRGAREEGTYERRYLAIAALSQPLAEVGAWDGAIGAGKDPRHRAVGGPDAKASRTRWRVVARAGGEAALLAVEPETGRTHQIRVHASHAGAPLLGDRDYGGPSRLTTASGRVVALARIALHCARVVVPSASAKVEIVAEIPDELRRVWAELGGAAEAWNTALTCSVVAPAVSSPSS